LELVGEALNEQVEGKLYCGAAQCTTNALPEKDWFYPLRDGAYVCRDFARDGVQAIEKAIARAAKDKDSNQWMVKHRVSVDVVVLVAHDMPTGSTVFGHAMVGVSSYDKIRDVTTLYLYDAQARDEKPHQVLFDGLMKVGSHDRYAFSKKLIPVFFLQPAIQRKYQAYLGSNHGHTNGGVDHQLYASVMTGRLDVQLNLAQMLCQSVALADMKWNAEPVTAPVKCAKPGVKPSNNNIAISIEPGAMSHIVVASGAGDGVILHFDKGETGEKRANFQGLKFLTIVAFENPVAVNIETADKKEEVIVQPGKKIVVRVNTNAKIGARKG
jgi:hypothetical protein